MKKRDYSSTLIFAALLVTSVRYAGAFLVSDAGEVRGIASDILSGAMAISGLGMGILEVLGLAYVFDGWRRALPKSGQGWSARFKVLTGFVIALFAVSVFILVPFTYSRLHGISIEDALGDAASWVWSAAVIVAPFLMIGGITLAQPGFVSHMPEQNPQSAPRNPQTAKQKTYKCGLCGYTAKTQNAVNAHKRWNHKGGE